MTMSLPEAGLADAPHSLGMTKGDALHLLGMTGMGQYFRWSYAFYGKK